MSNETRNHKDNVFCLLYKDRKNLLSLYNAMNGTHYEKEEELEVVTLEEAFCMKMRNDAAFVIDSRLNLYEQQSSANPNMPLRDLYYVAEELKKIAPPNRLHRTSKVQIPVPHFIVFYNGAVKQPERQVYKLSDLFLREEKNPELELTVTVININRGYNKELLEKCESLRGYMIFVEKVRDKKAAGIKPEKAVSQAVEECISEGCLSGFFKEHKKEIVEMGVYEFDQEIYDRELWEDGMEIGKESGTLRGIENLMDTLKMTAEEAMAALKVPKEKWEIYVKRLEEGFHDREEIYKGGIFEIDQEDYERVRRKYGGAIEIEKGRDQVLHIYKKIQAGEGDSKTIAESCGCTVEEVEMIRKELEI